MTTRIATSRRLARIAALGLAMSSGGSALFAQQHPPASTAQPGMHHGMMGDMQMDDCPMMAAMAQGPERILRRREELGLTPVQIGQLEVLATRSRQARAEAMAGMTGLHARLDSLARRDRFDESAVRAAFDRMGALHADLGVAMLKGQYDSRSLLTGNQRQKLSAGRQGAGGMAGMMGHGSMGMTDMTNCPMMTMPAEGRDSTRGASGSSRTKRTPAPRKATTAPRDSAAPMEHHGHTPPAASTP